MSSYYAAYYGSGLRLNEDEFEDFVSRYLAANNTTKRDIVKGYDTAVGMECDDGRDDGEESYEDEFESMVICWAVAFRWASDIGKDGGRQFYVTHVSPDDSDGMTFHPYRGKDGKSNVYYVDQKAKTKNPAFADYQSLRGETSYVFFSEKSLDGPEVFEERPYNSYEEFVQEFKDKMAAYLPEDFDWDAHIGRFSYALYA